MKDEEPRPYWLRKTLSEMTEAEWEGLCDGCGRCCLHKLEDEETGAVQYTTIACRLFDVEACQCRAYEQRHSLVPECVRLTPHNIPSWMPDTCAYRLVAEGRDLPDWHPLKTGDAESPHTSGVSVRDRVVSEADLLGGIEDYDWDAISL